MSGASANLVYVGAATAADSSGVGDCMPWGGSLAQTANERIVVKVPLSLADSLLDGTIEIRAAIGAGRRA
jgi:hypothetical protein